MNKCSFILKRSFGTLTSSVAEAIVIIFSLTVSIFTALILTSAAYNSYSEIAEILEYKKQYNLSQSVTDEPTDGEYMFIDKILSDEFPTVYNIGAEVSPAGSSDEYLGAASLDDLDNADYTPETYVYEGRLFTDEEFENGDDVVILSVKLAEAGGYEIGDTVDLGGTELTIIGTSELFTAVPVKTAVKHGWSVRISRVVFSDYLTSEQEERLEKLLVNAGALSVSSYFDLWYGKTKYTEIMTRTMWLLIMLAISAMIISSVFGYMVKSRLREFSIYKILGISGGSLLAVFYIPIGIMYLISMVLGFLVFKLSKPVWDFFYLETSLNWWLVLADAVVILTVLAIVTLPKYVSILRHDPKESGDAL